ncbi:65-kDa microtubule-associated protein 9-like [Juglans regia]|uniref:65-kDa microtubule-associated protein 9-like n=1 Tax=Juglans regia TaxID=51240 RepID=A0A6P9EFQ2_JUGRE|nr:65-kDa microtubule-associated protein 9-like [Juglans regia]
MTNEPKDEDLVEEGKETADEVEKVIESTEDSAAVNLREKSSVESHDQECLEVCRRKQSVQNTGSLKEELSRILPQLEEMRKRKSERRNQFLETQEQIQKISNEIYGSTECISSVLVVDESDLSLRKLEELHRELHERQKEKRDRLRQVQEQVCALNSLCSMLGVDSKKILTEVHPSLRDSERSTNLSNCTIEQLAAAIQKWREVKLQRMQRLQDLGALEFDGYTNGRATNVSECYL